LPYDYQPAQKPQEENIRRQLLKLGNTIYQCNQLEITTDAENPFIPSSLLAELRRKAFSNPSVIGCEAALAEQERREETYSSDSPYSSYREEGLLMQCRYCLRHELGYCSKYSARMPWKEPLSISLSDSEKKEEFLLRFNCARCQMEVLKK